MAPSAKDGPPSLKRLGGGRWQTRDERFTIEPQSGTWVVVDSAQTDELGLPLVRGPFGSLTAAKTAIEDARTSAAPASPIPARTGAKKPRQEAPELPDAGTPGKRPRAGTGAPAQEDAAPPRTERAARPARTKAAPDEPEEPRWLRELEPDDRRRARRWIERLREGGAPDPEGMIRRDVVGDVPAVAAWAIRRAVLAAGGGAAPAAVAALVAGGRDDELGVRWHLVDGNGRRIQLDHAETDAPGDR